ncbi:hypothetical protein [Sphingomonas sanguinis]|uniref:hypothetical protein n=1 Tax=Sphingomonas sanguinis TaxID=33051 RepID=UPI0007361F06|nr:hypothetical protein [Sphingomonas sanguinis]
MTDLTERLRECPFCGGEAKLVSGSSSTVQCQNDQCIIGDGSRLWATPTYFGLRIGSPIP